MTEPNFKPNPAPNHASSELAAEAGAPGLAADVAWPEEQPPIQDAAVNAVLDRLAAVRQTPVSGHGEVYGGMHDALLEALNEDVAGPARVARGIQAAGDGGS